jgi:hypothetical protein
MQVLPTSDEAPEPMYLSVGDIQEEPRIEPDSLSVGDIQEEPHTPNNQMDTSPLTDQIFHLKLT